MYGNRHAVRSAVGRLEERAHELHRIESEGESQWTPLLATVGVAGFILMLLLALLAITFAASHFLG